MSVSDSPVNNIKSSDCSSKHFGLWPIQISIHVKPAFGPFIYVKTALGTFISAKKAFGPFIYVKMAFGPYIRVTTAFGPLIHVKMTLGPFIYVKTTFDPLISIKTTFGPFISIMSNFCPQSQLATHKAYKGIIIGHSQSFKYRYYSQWSACGFALELDPTHFMNTKGSPTVQFVP